MAEGKKIHERIKILEKKVRHIAEKILENPKFFPKGCNVKNISDEFGNGRTFKNILKNENLWSGTV